MTRARSLSLLLLVALLGGAASSRAKTLAPGVSRWAVKTSLEAGANVSHPLPVRLHRVIALADVPGLANNDRRFRSARIPDAVDGLHEGDIVAVKGWLHIVGLEDDGDYHIQISESRDSGDPCFIVEVPNDDAAFVRRDAAVRRAAGRVRAWVRTQLLAGREPGETTRIDHAPFVRVVGQLFFDDAHLGRPGHPHTPRGKHPPSAGIHGGQATSLWEIHPILSLAFAPEPAR